ncbi:hypothetical protein AAG906_022877 [Vitis piasezkii]
MALSYNHLLLVFCVFENYMAGDHTGYGEPQLMDGGLELRPGQSVVINATQGWSGRFGATVALMNTTCQCQYSFPMGLVTVTCVSGLNHRCPKDLQVLRNGTVVACNSACMAFNKPEYCCSGAYSTPKTCKPTEHSDVFKASCPTSYSYAYEDPTNTFTCK